MGGRYRLDHLLGEGGMGAVYAATGPDGEPLALKLMHRSGDDEERFTREAALLCSIQHPGVVRILDFGRDTELDASYLVMERIAGESLESFVGEPMPWETALQVIEGVAEALAEAHLNGIVHRDVKAANVMLVRDGSEFRTVLVDFGIARSADPRYANLTAEGAVFGTPDYMAPEQCHGPNVGPAADVYSLGVLLYELLTGRVPFEGSPMEVLIAKQRQSPTLPESVAPDRPIPPEVAELAIAMLAIDPRRRPQTAGEVVQKVRRIRGGGERTLTLRAGELRSVLAETRGSDATAASRSPLPLAIAGAVAIAAMFAVVAWDLSREPSPEPLEPAAASPERPAAPTPAAAPATSKVDLGIEEASTVAPDVGRASDPAVRCDFEPTLSPGARRQFPTSIAIVPESLDPTKPAPLLFVFWPGATDHGVDELGLPEFAEERGWVVVVGKVDIEKHPPDDYMKRLVGDAQELIREVCVDPRRRYAFGVRYGGKLAMYFARMWQTSAVGVFAGRLGRHGKERLPPDVPLIQLHGRRDTIRPLEGGPRCTDLAKWVHSAEDDAGYLREGRSCRGVLDSTDEHGAECRIWDCEARMTRCFVDADFRMPRDVIPPEHVACQQGPQTDYPVFERVADFFEEHGRLLAAEADEPRDEVVPTDED